MTREWSGKVLTELNPGLSLSRNGTVGSWNTIFRSSSFGNLIVPLIVRMGILGHYSDSELALLDRQLNIPFSDIAQPQNTVINKSASYFYDQRLGSMSLLLTPSLLSASTDLAETHAQSEPSVVSR